MAAFFLAPNMLIFGVFVLRVPLATLALADDVRLTGSWPVSVPVTVMRPLIVEAPAMFSAPAIEIVSFEVSVSADAHVYIFQSSPKSGLTVLFPDARIGTQNLIYAGLWFTIWVVCFWWVREWALLTRVRFIEVSKGS